MEKSNIIISIIIVLCIAAAVAAYGITNSDNPIFSDLSSMQGKDAGHGLGNNSSINRTNGTSVAQTAGDSGSSSSDSGYSDEGSSSGSDSGYYSSDSGSGSSSDYSSDSSSSSSSSGTSLSYSDAQSIAAGAVSEPGCYAGGGYYSDGYWYFTVYNEEGTAVDSISVSDSSGATGRG